MTPPCEAAKLPTVHPLRACCVAAFLTANAGILTAQVPASADMWRLSAATLAGPAALEGGASGAFWNPAAAWTTSKVRVGAQVLQTPDVLGVTSLIAGATYRWPHAAAQLLVARTQVGDLVRTTTSPTSDLGEIPVYEQMVGVGAAFRSGRLTGGALLRAHNARFDTERDNGVTLDVGCRIVLPRLSFAAATHFFPLDMESRAFTDYYAAVEGQVARLGMWGAPGRLFMRYGLSARRGSGPEHGGSVGLELNERFEVDAALVREAGYPDRTTGQREGSWRPAVGVELRVGRYAITAARSSGLGGIGASYRIGLDVDALR